VLLPGAEANHVQYRVILFRERGTEVLLEPNGTRFTFPRTKIPRRAGVAESLSAAMRRDFRQKLICLFPVEDTTHSQADASSNYYVAETLCPHEDSASARWLPVRSINEASFAQTSEYALLQSSLARCRSLTRVNQNSFEKLGWFDEVRNWVSETLRPLGLELRTQFRQCHATPSFSLIRFETSGPAVWFKAVGEPNLREYQVSLRLAESFPRFVPKVLGSRPEWNAWLMFESLGTHLDQNSSLNDWVHAVTTLADLQIASVGSTLQLVDAGCRDLRSSILVEQVDGLLDLLSDIMKQQKKATPPALSVQELDSLGGELKRCLSDLNESTIPSTLGHLDLNPGNILVSDRGCVFLDWAEACVSHPFVTFHYLLEHLRKLHPTDSSWEQTLTSIYVNKWRYLAAQDGIHQALPISRLATVFAYATSVAHVHGTGPAGHAHIAPYLRSLARRMKREANELRERRSTCLP
jgi:Phosphotransferase enzyme family